jgi:hypothetical protein
MCAILPGSSSLRGSNLLPWWVCQARDRGFAKKREEVTHEERGHERVPAVDDLEQTQRRLVGVRVGRARRDQRTVLPDLLRPLDARQLAQLVDRIRHCPRVDDRELLDAHEAFAREQLDVISVPADGD